MAPRATEGLSATIRLTVSGEAAVTLAAQGDHLGGKGAAFTDEHPKAIVTVAGGSTPETGRFELHLKPTEGEGEGEEEQHAKGHHGHGGDHH